MTIREIVSVFAAAIVLAAPAHAQPAQAQGNERTANAAAAEPRSDAAANGVKPAPADSEEPGADEPNHLVLALAGIALLAFIVFRKGRRDE